MHKDKEFGNRFMQKQMCQLKSTLQSGRNIDWHQGHMCDSTRECTWYQRQGVPILPQIFSFSIFQHFSALCGPFCELVVDLTSISPWIPEEDKRKSRQTSPPPSPITAPARVYSASSHRWSQNHRHERTHLGVRLFVPLNLSGKSCEPQPHS